MITKMAGPSGCHDPGDVIDVAVSTAAGLIGGGFATAVEVGAAPVERAVVAPEETSVTIKRKR